ncbi:hypothetical protein GCM10010329_52090 [Streptomyces spiroverticillatus]|uniref:Uncharacterized protein n=1 Tax=Streptomyces finlayi TaxID=67296 RepID=A0A918X221_9ACTN|nr:hypothetical protein [Streptomyces finlayi]GHA22340.1 hypothetical protein GCM10010329_52090 [Streptomyces spiroverticillatus]GHD04338.1 hypothetical protein GCM10010334_53030 [Streptomyces finlayi]
MRRITTTLLLAGALGLGLTSPSAVALEQHPASARAACGGKAADYAGFIYTSASAKKEYRFERGGKVAVAKAGRARVTPGTYRADASGLAVTAGGATAKGAAKGCHAGTTVPKAIVLDGATYTFVQTG